VFGWMRRRRMSSEAHRRLVLALARAEETLIETHVRNALEVIASIGEEVPLHEALELYIEELEPGEPRASIVARRVLARLESGTGGGGAAPRGR